ncbi:MAG: PAS domain-containing sensor histidine kinase [Desulfuromonadales bacterium]|nr:PAS domain-containing sensor histidine kinase [Desulfuromonadales bacterium]
MQDPLNQRNSHILSLSPAIIYAGRVDEPFYLTFISENLTSRLGFDTKVCLHNPDFWRELIHPDDVECVFDDYVKVSANDFHKHEYRLRKEDGEYLWVLDELRLVRDASGRPLEVIGSWLDITDRKETERALQQSERLFRVFFQSNPVATIISSTDGVVHMVNPAFTKHTDFTADEVVGRTAQELGFWRIPKDRERMVSAIQEFGFIDNLESQFYGKGGLRMTCLVSSRAVDFGGEVRILSIVQDVTEQRKAEASLLKLDQAKTAFLSTAAHELRTPLIAIVGYSELLENEAGLPLEDEQKQEYLSIIQSNAEILNRLVDDLLDVGRIQIGRSLGVVLKEAQLSEVIEKVVGSLTVKNELHRIIVVHTNPLPERSWFDPGRITQVLYNLLSNAIKYSSQGGNIEIQTTTASETVSVAVVDQGQGMSPALVENVFDRFYRGEDADAEIHGLGLGMGIVKQIIEDHGGEIVVKSCLGEGTTVTFTLPIKPERATLKS